MSDDIPPGIGALHDLYSPFAVNTLQLTLPDNEPKPSTGLPMRQAAHADGIALDGPGSKPAPDLVTPLPSVPSSEAIPLPPPEAAAPDVMWGAPVPLAPVAWTAQVPVGLRADQPVLMMLPENPNGWKLEELLDRMMADLKLKNSKVSLPGLGDKMAANVMNIVIEQNLIIITYLKYAREEQMKTLALLDLCLPNTPRRVPPS